MTKMASKDFAEGFQYGLRNMSLRAVRKWLAEQDASVSLSREFMAGRRAGLAKKDDYRDSWFKG